MQKSANIRQTLFQTVQEEEDMGRVTLPPAGSQDLDMQQDAESALSNLYM